MCMSSFQDAASCALCSILSASCTKFSVWMPKKKFRISVSYSRKPLRCFVRSRTNEQTSENKFLRFISKPRKVH